MRGLATTALLFLLYELLLRGIFFFFFLAVVLLPTDSSELPLLGSAAKIWSLSKSSDMVNKPIPPPHGMRAGQYLGLENIEEKLCFPITVFNHVMSDTIRV